MDIYIVISLTILLSTSISSSSATTLAEQCRDSFQEVPAGCLKYATGTANSPAKACCTDIQHILNYRAEWFCCVISEVHDGGDNTQSLSLQESRLLQLPAACNLSNGILSNCPSDVAPKPLTPYDILTDPNVAMWVAIGILCVIGCGAVYFIVKKICKWYNSKNNKIHPEQPSTEMTQVA